MLTPPGYLPGVGYGLALVQTTRSPSNTRRGWMDITLALAVTRFGSQASTIDLETSPKVNLLPGLGARG